MAGGVVMALGHVSPTSAWPHLQQRLPNPCRAFAPQVTTLLCTQRHSHLCPAPASTVKLHLPHAARNAHGTMHHQTNRYPCNCPSLAPPPPRPHPAALGPCQLVPQGHSWALLREGSHGRKRSLRRMVRW
jgi:hypothetical protein